ncbi:MAG: Gfo/Idh/MocA family protein [Planctomycetaceae bacterium]
MSDIVSRREFLRAALLAGTALPASGWPARRARNVLAAEREGPNERLNLGIIGVAAKGEDNLNNVASENILVLCDIDAERLARASDRFPDARTCDDYRRVLDQPNLDGVVISAPDHMHAIPTAAAIRRGLAVYCEKPLTHTVFEARTIRDLAAQHKVVTQMGTQIHAENNYRRVVEIVKAGVVGPINRVHVWQGGTVPACQRVAAGKPPAHVNYDLWLGPAPYRPFHASHFHFKWRWWWDFGGGILADFGCHYMDLPFWALDLEHPLRVHCTRSERGPDLDEHKQPARRDNEPPNQMQVEYWFPARGDQPPVQLTWYHGGWMPEGAEAYEKNSAVLFEGTRGRLLADYFTHKVFLQSGAEAGPVKPTIADSIGHWKEWLNAVKTGGTTTCRFDYAGALTEVVLLGNVSQRAGHKLLEWDAEKLVVRNDPQATALLHTEYRRGWTL